VRILITGASGAGATTLGEVLSSRMVIRHLDTDTWFWVPTDPRFTTWRSPSVRLALALRDLGEQPDAVVSGAVMGWGAPLEDAFDLVVFLYVNADVRMARLKAREMRRFGRIDPDFIQWAAQYDEGPSQGRSLKMHNDWLARLRCPVLRIEGDTTVNDRVAQVVQRCTELGLWNEKTRRHAT
jgi:adenylate kinase family enzyme